MVLSAVTDCEHRGASCLASAVGLDQAQLALPLAAGQSVYLVVDGAAAEDLGPYSLRIVPHYAAPKPVVP